VKEPTRAERNIQWIEDNCRVPEGVDVGRPVVLRPWQQKEIIRIYDNPHVTRRAILSFGRKNGKTALAAFLLLLHLCGPEAQLNSQLFSAAQSRDQAAVLFGLAAKMVRMSPEMNAHVIVRDSGKQLAYPEFGTLYRALSAEVSTSFGLSPVFLVHDELGQVRGERSPLYDALETAMAAHENPLSVVISTQAPSDGDLLSILIDDAKAAHDPQTVLSLYTADMEADPFAEETIRQANPAFGDFQNAAELMAEAADAKRMPSMEARHRNLYLNQRVDAHNPFVSRSVWETCGGEPEPFGDEPIYAGLDLSARADLTACVLMFERDAIKHVHPYFWLPEDGLAERARKDRVPYDLWAQQGFLRTTPGGSVDYEYVVKDLAEILDGLDLGLMTFDRWRIKEFTKEAERAGLNWPMEPHGQGFKDMSPALDSLEADLLNARLRHGMHPVLTMCAANAIVTMDPADNRKLDKKKANGRIDGMQALAMVETAMTRQPVAVRPVGRIIAL
jgi:phage terminase large subunit-like protein